MAIDHKGIEHELHVARTITDVEATTVYPKGMLVVNSAGVLKLGDGTTAGGAVMSTASSVDWSQVTGTPTTLQGYGITNAGSVVAFAHVDVADPPTVESGSVNVQSVVISSTGKFDVTFNTALSNANYVVILTAETDGSSSNYELNYYNRTATGFQIQRLLDGYGLDSAPAGGFSFVVCKKPGS